MLGFTPLILQTTRLFALRMRSRCCDYVCHCATSFLVEFIRFLFGSIHSCLVRSCKTSEVPGASAVQSFHSALPRFMKGVHVGGLHSVGRVRILLPPFMRCGGCCNGTGTAWWYGEAWRCGVTFCNRYTAASARLGAVSFRANPFLRWQTRPLA